MKNWKKTLSLLLIIAVVCSTAIVALAGCTGDYTVIHVSDTGNALDDNYNEAIWNALEDLKAAGEKVATISALGLEDRDFQKTIKKCVNNYNAKYIVLGSAKFRSILTEEFVSQFPTTTFIYFEDTTHSTNNESYTLVDQQWIDGTDDSYTIKVKYEEYSYPVAANVICLTFDQYELGYAAGYSAAQLGNDIAFFGSSATRPVYNADGYALGEDGTTVINDDTNPVKYETYTTKSMQKYYEGFVAGVSSYATIDTTKNYSIQYTIERADDSDLNKRTILDKMVANGIDVLFAAAGDSYNQKLRDICNEKDYNKYIINADLNLTVAASSDTKLSHGSILRDYKGATKYILANIADNPAWLGTTMTLTHAQDGINWAFGEDITVDMQGITYLAPATTVTVAEVK